MEHPELCPNCGGSTIGQGLDGVWVCANCGWRDADDELTCPGCGAVYHQGHWQWQASRPADAQEVNCPACQRIADKVPAGLVEISGDFFVEHREEIKGLIRNLEEKEKGSHPLNRCGISLHCETSFTP